MELLIVSKVETLYQGKVDRIQVVTTDGELGILKDHAPIVAELISSDIVFYEKGKEKENKVSIGSGFLHFKNNVANVTVSRL